MNLLNLFELRLGKHLVSLSDAICHKIYGLCFHKVTIKLRKERKPMSNITGHRSKNLKKLTNFKRIRRNLGRFQKITRVVEFLML